MHQFIIILFHKKKILQGIKMPNGQVITMCIKVVDTGIRMQVKS